MTTRKVALVVIISLLLVSLIANTGFSQSKTDESKVTIKGKIGYMKNLGGYYVQGREPGGEYMIVNENPGVLKKLMKGGKILTIDGHYTRGPEYLFIEKIDGKKYSGKKKSSSK